MLHTLKVLLHMAVTMYPSNTSIPCSHAAAGVLAAPSASARPLAAAAATHASAAQLLLLLI
jgi:hypothetical protein